MLAEGSVGVSVEVSVEVSSVQVSDLKMVIH